MSKGHVSFHNAGRLGNWAFECSAALGYALDHNMPFSAPSVPAFGRNEQWNPIYCKHLIDPAFDPSPPTIVIEEKGYPFQPLPWSEKWRDSNIVLNGFWQSEKYWSHHRERVLEAFGFPWTLNEGLVAVHVRRTDYLKWIDKHPAVSKEWYEDQMDKFPGYSFQFFSDDIEWCRDNFEDHPRCHFDQALYTELPDKRTEVVDLVEGSCCEHVIGSASTFAIWMGLLGRNPGRRVIIPKEWICNGWQGTTAKDWADVCPQREGWERA